MAPLAAWADARAVLAALAVCVLAGGLVLVAAQWLAGTWEWLTRPRRKR